MSDNTHHHTCKFAGGSSACAGVEPGDCVCDCGAVFHILGWQVIEVLPPPPESDGSGGVEKNPCAVIVDEGEFDVEDYRSDLERRRGTLLAMADNARSLYNGNRNFNSASALAARENMNRFENKARGLEIALSLLPRKP